MTDEVTAASSRWFRRPLYRDWALWLGVVVGLVIELANSRTRQVGVLNETPFFLLQGIFLVGLVVGTVRQFRIGMAEGGDSGEFSPLAQRIVRARQAWPGAAKRRA